jgi:hypothetical protein
MENNSTKREKKFTISVNEWYMRKLGESYVKEQIIPKLYEQADAHFKYGWILLSLNFDFNDEKQEYLFTINCQSKEE